VVSGQGIGSRQTVPTLNLAPGSGVIPKTGVYVTRTRDLDRPHTWNSITNVGYRPTFDGQSLTIETFLLQPLAETPQNIRVQFLLRLRDERKFETPEALKTQIFRDVARAQTYFRRVPK
jgi:riboflavin kinase / FMN adenylyltransferase